MRWKSQKIRKTNERSNGQVQIILSYRIDQLSNVRHKFYCMLFKAYVVSNFSFISYLALRKSNTACERTQNKNAQCAAKTFISRPNWMVCARGGRDHHFFSSHRVEFNLSEHLFSQFTIQTKIWIMLLQRVRCTVIHMHTHSYIVCDPHTASHQFIYSFIQSFLVLFHFLIFSSFIRLRVCLHLIYVIDLRNSITWYEKNTMVLVVTFFNVQWFQNISEKGFQFAFSYFKVNVCLFVCLHFEFTNLRRVHHKYISIYFSCLTEYLDENPLIDRCSPFYCYLRHQRHCNYIRFIWQVNSSKNE